MELDNLYGEWDGGSEFLKELFETNIDQALKHANDKSKTTNYGWLCF
jgi:hypothetical protein